MRSVLRAASERKIDVILDVHNYGRYHSAGEKVSQIIGAGRISPADFADFWGKLARAFKDEPALYGYGLMNEPHDMGDAELGPRAAQAAIEAIRKVDTQTPIVVAGDNWSGARDWAKNANAQLPDKLRDPAGNLVYEAHCDFDKDGSGQYKASDADEQGSPDVGVERARPFVEWCRANKVRGFMGEFGVTSADARWLATMDRFLSYLKENDMPATYWAGPGGAIIR